jgi:hypothetical protein
MGLEQDGDKKNSNNILLGVSFAGRHFVKTKFADDPTTKKAANLDQGEPGAGVRYSLAGCIYE